MSEQNEVVYQEEKESPDFIKGLPFNVRQQNLVDLCVQVAFAREEETFVDFADFSFPSVICNCICENVEITSRSISFDCNHVTLCIEYIICLKFFPKVGDPYCQSFQACFTKTIPFFEFERFPGGGSITLEEFQAAEGACIEVRFDGCFCFLSPGICFTRVFNDVFFTVRVKLFQERNVVVLGEFFGGPVAKLPKEVSSCGLTNFAVEGTSNCTAKSEERLSELPAESRALYEKGLAEFMKKMGK